MNTIRNTVARPGAWLSTIALVAAMHLGDAAFAQATSKPPERMTYQGFIAGSDGVALGNTAPKNYDVIFRIYEGEGSTTALWGEQQTVTVDKGYFSILLGEGAAVPGTPNAGITLSSLFNSATASDRYVGFTVKGVGSGGADLEILPRVRLMTSPYAFLANKALAADTATGALKLVQQGNGAELLAASGSELSVKGNLLLNAGKYLMLGVGSGKEASAGMISYQHHTPDSLEIIGAGTTSANRKITLYSEGGLGINGSVGINGNLGVNGDMNVGVVNSGGKVQLRPDLNGIVFGADRPKQFPWNGSIMYASGQLANGEDTLLIQGGGNNTGLRSVTVFADGGLLLHAPLLMPGNRPINIGYGIAGKDVSAGNIGYQLYTGGLDIVGAGTAVDNRNVGLHGSVTIHAIESHALPPLSVFGSWRDSSGRNIAISANHQVRASGFLNISDRRIKDVVGLSNPDNDLQCLRKIRVTDYRLKDAAGSNQQVIKGVIAQEAESVIPSAVSKSPDIIPCERISAVLGGWKSADKPLTLKLDAEHGLTVGQEIRVEADGVPVTASVKGILDSTTVEISGLGVTAEPKSVALVGRGVKDFLSVDYQQVYMTAVSALQEVDRRLQAVDQRVQEVEKREARVAELEKKAAARVEGLERDMAELRKLVASMQSTKGKAESASAAPSTTPVVVVKSR